MVTGEPSIHVDTADLSFYPSHLRTRSPLLTLLECWKDLIRLLLEAIIARQGLMDEGHCKVLTRFALSGSQGLYITDTILKYSCIS